MNESMKLSRMFMLCMAHYAMLWSQNFHLASREIEEGCLFVHVVRNLCNEQSKAEKAEASSGMVESTLCPMFQYGAWHQLLYC